MQKVKVLWASPHEPTDEQVSSLKEWGEVVYLKEVNNDLFLQLTDQQFNSDLGIIAEELIEFCSDEGIATVAQPGGSPAFQYTLGWVSQGCAWAPEVIYSFSKRVSEDSLQPDGSVKKVSTFIHEGWITSTE